MSFLVARAMTGSKLIAGKHHLGSDLTILRKHVHLAVFESEMETFSRDIWGSV